MSRIDLHIIPTADCSQSIYDELFQFLLPEMNSALFKLHSVKPTSKLDFSISASPSFVELFDLAERYRAEQKIPQKAFVIVVTERHNNQNFFCALGDGDSRSGFIHTKSWKLAAPDLSTKAEASANAYLIYSLILRRFQYTGEEHPNYNHLFNHAQFVHRDAKGCFNHWVADKRFIENLLNSVFICNSCQKSILAGGLTIQHFQIIKKVFERIRDKVIANDEIDSFENGHLYVFKNHIEVVYKSTDNYKVVGFSKKVGEMGYFTLYVYLILMNRKVDLLEWNNDPSNFQIMRRILNIAQGPVLKHQLLETESERFEEMNVLKKFGTLNPNPKHKFEFLDTNIGTYINRINKKFTKLFESMGMNETMAKSTGAEYFIKGTSYLNLNFDRTRIYFADCWMNEFGDEFPHMQRMPE